MPPLRERREEIPALVEFFLLKFSKVYRRPVPRPSRVLSDALLEYAWPGNIRELENMMKRFVVLQEESLILKELLRPRPASPSLPAEPVAAPSQPRPRRTRTSCRAQPGTGTSGARRRQRHAPGAAQAIEQRATVDSGEGIDLQALAKSAAMRAERDAIELALVRFRWNRRKAADYLRELQDAAQQDEGVRHHRFGRRVLRSHKALSCSGLLPRMGGAAPNSGGGAHKSCLLLRTTRR